MDDLFSTGLHGQNSSILQPCTERKQCKAGNSLKFIARFLTKYFPLKSYIFIFIIIIRYVEKSLSKNVFVFLNTTVCPRNSDPFYVVSYNIRWGNYFLDIWFKPYIPYNLGTFTPWYLKKKKIWTMDF